jgi:hypothetical protein
LNGGYARCPDERRSPCRCPRSCSECPTARTRCASPSSTGRRRQRRRDRQSRVVREDARPAAERRGAAAPHLRPRRKLRLAAPVAAAAAVVAAAAVLRNGVRSRAAVRRPCAGPYHLADRCSFAGRRCGALHSSQHWRSMTALASRGLGREPDAVAAAAEDQRNVLRTLIGVVHESGPGGGAERRPVRCQKLGSCVQIDTFPRTDLDFGTRQSRSCPGGAAGGVGARDSLPG